MEPCSRILTKPLKCSLVGALKKTVLLDDTPVNQSLVDCTYHLLTELDRIDHAGGDSWS